MVLYIRISGHLTTSMLEGLRGQRLKAQLYIFGLIFTRVIMVRRRKAVQGTTYRAFLERP